MLTPTGLDNVRANADLWLARQSALLSPLRAADAGVALRCAARASKVLRECPTSASSCQPALFGRTIAST
jgi:hypothetical protein